MSTDVEKFEKSYQEATDAFFSVFVDAYDLKSGDFPPEAEFEWTEVTQRLAKSYILGNTEEG